MDWSKLPLWILLLLLVPMTTGYLFCHLLKIKKNIASCYLFGTYFQWGLLQILAVPLILTKQSFTLLTWIYSIILLVLCICSVCVLIRQREKREIRTRNCRKPEDWFAFALMIVGYLALAVCIALMQHTDLDDSRFVVNAVDIVRTNRMMLTNPSTGAELTSFVGDMVRDSVCPWAVYIAFCSKMTGTYATIMAHSILPQSLTLCMFAVYWLLAERYFNKSMFSKCAMVLLCFLVNVYGCYTGYSAEAFGLFRIWQGKAVIASSGIPIVFLALSFVFDAPEKMGHYVLLYFVILALCLMSGMGVIIGGIMCGCTGIIYGILKRKVCILWGIWGGLVICGLYYGVDLLLTKGIIS